jgi:hypothetical protein
MIIPFHPAEEIDVRVTRVIAVCLAMERECEPRANSLTHHSLSDDAIPDRNAFDLETSAFSRLFCAKVDPQGAFRPTTEGAWKRADFLKCRTSCRECRGRITQFDSIVIGLTTVLGPSRRA